MNQPPSLIHPDDSSQPMDSIGSRVSNFIAERPELILVVVLMLLALATGSVEPEFLTASGLRNTLLQAAPLGSFSL